ncbi:MAG: efflux RND transporter periplasmic adaptor subunit [Acidobacteriota bacterium]
MSDNDKPPAAVYEAHPRNAFSERALRLGRRGIFFALLLAAALTVLIVWLLAGKKGSNAAEESEEVVVSVRVAKAERQPIAQEVTALGTIFPRKEATVSAKVAAPIKTMPLLRNKSVREGDVIATLESRDIQSQRAEAAAALEEAKLNARAVVAGSIPQTTAQDQKAVRDARANLTNARAVYERRKVLYDQGGISRKELDASQLALATAESDLQLAESTARLHATSTQPNDLALAASRVAQAQQRLAGLDSQLSYATIRAPFSGVITEQFQFEGEFASPGGKLFTIGDVSEVIVKAPVADTVAAQLKVGETAKILPQESPGEELIGVISLVSKGSDPQSRTVEVWVNLKNEGGRLRANSAAKVVLETSKAEDAVVVPAAAVTLDATNGNEGKVMVVDNESLAHETKVTVGIRTLDRVEITSGLKGGETVVVEGSYALPDGSKVKISEPEETEPPEK